MRKVALLFVIPVILSVSCSSNLDARIKLLEDELNIDLPEDYEVIQDDDISHNGFESDYTLIVKLQLQLHGTEDVRRQIEKAPFFNQLGKFYDERTRGVVLLGKENIDAYHNIEDSIQKTNYRASWFKDKNGYKLMDFGNKYEFIHAFLDTVDNTLMFEYNSL